MKAQEESEIRMMMLSMKSSPEMQQRMLQGSPTVATRLMLQGYKSGTFGTVSDTSIEPCHRVDRLRFHEVQGAWESKSDELLAKSQFLLDRVVMRCLFSQAFLCLSGALGWVSGPS